MHVWSVPFGAGFFCGETMGAGRPTKYNSEWHPELAFLLARDGLTDAQIADRLGIAKSTLEDWKKRHPGFKEHIKTGKKEPDDLVEHCLFQRATGYQYPEDRIMQYEGKPVIVPTIKHVPPDVTAMIFWLKNRRPKQWRDKHDIDVNENINITAQVSYTIEFLRRHHPKVYQELVSNLEHEYYGN